jgi:DNA-binding XRE family transcriptional regulator
MLAPSEIGLLPETAEARPGPPAANEARRLEALKRSLLSEGQLVPLIVDPQHRVLDGRRRLTAALTIEGDGTPFPLECVVDGATGGDPLRLAVRANLDRQGYTAVQMAHLFRAVRERHGWTGTREVAQYCGVSRATVSQCDKLLHKPEGMAQDVYDSLLALVADGRMGADAAFYTLTHVEPAQADAVVELAVQKAEREAVAQPSPDQTTGKPGANTPAGANARQTVSGKPAGTGKTTQAVPAAERTPAQRKEWMAQLRRESAARREKEKAERATKKAERAKEKTGRAEAEAPDRPVVPTRAQIAEAARELKATRDRDTGKGPHAVTRTVADLICLLDSLCSAAYPDIMRSFCAVLKTAWTRGDAAGKDVIAHWNRIAVLVEEAQARHTTAKPAKKAAKRQSGKA